MLWSGSSPMTVVRDGMWGFLLVSGVAWLAVSWSVLRLEPADMTRVAGPVVLFAAVTELVRALAGSRTWWLNAGMTVLFAATGALLLADGTGSWTSPAALIGWYLMVRGAADLAVAMLTRETDRVWGLLTVMGVAEAALGFFAASSFVRTAEAVVIVLGAAALLRGVADLVAALRLREATALARAQRLLELPPERAIGVAGYAAGLTDFDQAPQQAQGPRHAAATPLRSSAAGMADLSMPARLPGTPTAPASAAPAVAGASGAFGAGTFSAGAIAGGFGAGNGFGAGEPGGGPMLGGGSMPGSGSMLGGTAAIGSADTGDGRGALDAAAGVSGTGAFTGAVGGGVFGSANALGSAAGNAGASGMPGPDGNAGSWGAGGGTGNAGPWMTGAVGPAAQTGPDPMGRGGSFHDEVLRTTADLDAMLAMAGVTGTGAPRPYEEAAAEVAGRVTIPDTAEGAELPDPQQLAAAAAAAQAAALAEANAAMAGEHQAGNDASLPLLDPAARAGEKAIPGMDDTSIIMRGRPLQ